MKFTFVDEGVNVVVVDNFYSNEELQSVMDECLSVLPQLKSEDGTSPALSLDGLSLKKNHGAFIANDTSKMVSLMREKIFSQPFKDAVINSNSLYRILYSCEKINTLLSYYTNGDYYEEHVDDSIFTAIFYLYKLPKKFSGGEINLRSSVEDKIISIEPYVNRLIIFPSLTSHSVNPIIMENDTGADGRFAVSQFIQYESQRK